MLQLSPLPSPRPKEIAIKDIFPLRVRFWHILRFLGIEIDFSLLKGYFEKEFIDRVDKQYFDYISKDIIEKRLYRHAPDNVKEKYYAFAAITDYLQQTGFLLAMKEIGFYDYMLNIYRQIQQKAAALTVEYAALSSSLPEKH